MKRERKKLEPRIPGQEIKSFSFFCQNQQQIWQATTIKLVDGMEWRKCFDNWTDITCRNGLIAPLMRNESAAMLAKPSAGSRNCRNDIFGAVWLQVWAWAQQTTLLASGCELCRMIREPEFGDDVIRTGGMCCWTVSECGDKWPCAWLRTLSFDT